MKFSLIAVFFLVVAEPACAGTFSFSMRRLHTTGPKATSRVRRLTKTSSPLAAQYVVDIQVGTPPQTLTFGIDTQFSSLALESSRCNCKTNMFDDRKSSTFQDTGYRWSNDMDVDMGRIGYDTVNVSGLLVSQQEFALADVPYWSREPENPHLSSDPFDGILGLGAGPTGSIAGETPFLKNIVDKLDDPVFTLYMSHSGGQSTFGGKDTRNCDASWTYVGLFDENVWKVHLYGFQYGKYYNKATHDASFDTYHGGNEGNMVMPVPDIDHIVSVTGAEYNFDTSDYEVDCEKVKSFPPIVVTLGEGQQYTIAAKQYVIKNADGKCVLDLTETGNGPFEPMWVFGGPFLRTYCQLYDFGQSQIGLSLALHD